MKQIFVFVAVVVVVWAIIASVSPDLANWLINFLTQGFDQPAPWDRP